MAVENRTEHKISPFPDGKNTTPGHAMPATAMPDGPLRAPVRHSPRHDTAHRHKPRRNRPGRPADGTPARSHATECTTGGSDKPWRHGGVRCVYVVSTAIVLYILLQLTLYTVSNNCKTILTPRDATATPAYPRTAPTRMTARRHTTRHACRPAAAHSCQR